MEVSEGVFLSTQKYFENCISNFINTLADEPEKGQATKVDAPRPPVKSEPESMQLGFFSSDFIKAAS